ncbi:MAG TPA: ComEC/Rec2 family competence protein, partial [Gemmatimonadaceae bacterium]|nr:ComEC/Rec2 family competence protein [Gemmatimonadaceae bacterium]
MPLVGAAVLAYAAGLLSGYGDAAAWTIAAGIGVVWLCARQRRERLALGAVAVAGLSVAVVGRRERDACQERLARADSLEITLGADASPGAFVSGRHACGVAVRIAVDTGSAPGGARLVARGQVTAARGGVILMHAHVRKLSGPEILPRFRADVARRLDSLFGERAPLVRALLIADMQDLSPTLRDRFAAAGLSHMLSVSGLHVGLIAVAVALIAQLLGMARGRGDAVVVIVTTVYVVVIGAPLPAVRAAAMLGAYSLGRAVQRPTSPWAVLAIGAVLPLVDSRSVTDVGYQLSVVGMVALVAAGSITRRWSWTSERGWRGMLYRSLVTSTIATGLTAPLVAATFGRISLVAPVSNLVAVPVMAVLQPMLFLVALLLPLETAARFVADACVPLLAAVDWIASLAARLPGASVNVVADQTAIAIACVAGVAMVVAAVSRFPGRALVAGLACIALLIWRPLIPARAELTELH